VSGEARVLGGASSSKDDWFNHRESDRATFFVQEFCRHVKGPLTGENLRLQPWQNDIVSNLFGWKRPNGTRRYRYVWLEVPRKAGKSTFAAAIGLYMLMVDPEPGAEIVITASSTEHASVCFNIARDMVSADPDLKAVCKINRHGIFYKDACLHVVSSRHEAIHGRNISCLVFDDICLQTTRDLHDALITSMGARSQPLALYVTSAGSERSSLAWELHEYALKVKAGLVDDPAWLVSIFGASLEDDWTDPQVWRRSHPGLGVSISEEFIREECRRAERIPGFIASFQQLYLNVWVQERSRWLDMKKWDRCGRAPLDEGALAGRECRAGLDLSTTTDLSALVLVFRDEDNGYTVLPFAFCPAATIPERQRRDRVDYASWRERGFLITTEGNTIDHEAIRRKVLELARIYRIRELAYDRWNSSMLISRLVSDGLSCVPVAQSNSAMNASARDLERVLAENKLRHGGHPILRWCAGNAVPHVDVSGDIRPSKSKSIERIDLLVATLMAISRHLVAPASASTRSRRWARAEHF
jgi:phage terminase large subunit-like protein